MATLKIGEMAALFHISKQTLQYYDKIGIFKPKFVDENGYRYYAYDQTLKLASILYLKKMGLSLTKIEDLTRKLDIENYRVQMEDQHKLIEEEINRLIEIKKAMHRKVNFIEEQKGVENLDTITVEQIGPRNYYEIGRENELYCNPGFYYNPTIVFYIKDDRRFGCYIYGNNPNERFSTVIQTIPSGKFLCGYHQGPYETIINRVREMRAAYKNLELSPYSIHFNVIDQFVESDESKFLTWINIEILD